MSESAETAAEAKRLDALYRAKARVEIDAAEALVKGASIVRGQGDMLAYVLLVKGEPGPGDVAKGRALAGDDGAALGKALDALGLPKARFAFCTRVGRSAAKRLERLRLLTEAVDPRIVILLDEAAADDFALAYGVDRPVAGELVRVLGRDVLATSGFEAALADESRKRQVWRQLKALERATES
ncbi:MAG: hypothetical protein EG823_03070 [Actinobacteria bacterium]|nr:hypothetical protein [Actinomycetota bacterium]